MKTKTKHWASITASILSLAGYAAAASLDSEKYTYDASGNIIEKSIDGKVTKMTYDSSNRLLNSNKSSQSNDISTCDAVGNPIPWKTEDGQIQRSVYYGYDDRVVHVKNQDSNTILYYTADGQLIGKATDGNVSTYSWDGNVIAAENAKLYTNEGHASGGVPILNSGKDVVVSDYLGSTLSSGEKCFQSSSYGQGLEEGRFTGKRFIKELQAYLFQYRLYSLESSQWTTEDPSGYPDGRNNYQYANCDPINQIDPLGLIATYVRTMPAGILPDYTTTGTKNATIILTGKIDYWPEVTFSTDTTVGENGFVAFAPPITGAVGSTINVACSVVGSTPSTWNITGSYGGLSIGYTFGTAGTPASSGGINSPGLLDSTHNFWVGYGGLYQRKGSSQTIMQTFGKTSDGHYYAIEDPSQTGSPIVQPSSYLSINPGAKFVEWEY